MAMPRPINARAWIDSDTWYKVGEMYLNARTGVFSVIEPTHRRNDGSRRLSAASSGDWAVPFLSAPLSLPIALAACASSNSMLEPDAEVWGADGPLFTAPHGVNLMRDGKPDHLPEDFTTHLARTWAELTGGSSVVWPAAALAWCVEHEQPVPGARDPNYLSEAETDNNAWVRALSAMACRGLHVDVHGKRDVEGEADCDIGVGAVRALLGDVPADAMAAIVATSLSAALPGYRVDPRPRLQGCWRSVPRRSLTQSSGRLGFASVQLELGYNLRRALGRDRVMCVLVAKAFVAAAQPCVNACRLARARPY